jgi:hypothetical protein
VLQKTLIRHTKRQVIAGVQVLDLPPKSEEAVPGERAGFRALAPARAAMNANE